MLRKVIKYGGSNLRDPKGISQLISIADKYSDPIIIVSALYGVTDFIETYLNSNNFSPRSIKGFTDQLYRKHTSFANYHIIETACLIKINKSLNKRISELEHLLLGVFYLGELPVHLKNYIISYGERLSSLLLTEILNAHHYNCKEVLPESIGLTAVGDPQNATIDLDVSSKNVKIGLKANGIIVVPGFYGISKSGKIMLLGRGGTDYSAACIANCIDALALDIWKDVKGFHSIDPKYSKTSVKLEFLTYDEAAELAYFGAKILHPRTVEPLIEKNIPIRLFSTNQISPDPLTLINDKKTISLGTIKSITSTDEFSVLKLKGAGVGIDPGVLSKVAGILSENNININSVITSQIAINLIINRSFATRAEILIRELELSVIKEISILSEVSLVALVGHGMIENHGLALRTFSVLARNNINVHLSSMGASEITTYLIINRDDKEKAISELHHEFFNYPSNSQLKTGKVKFNVIEN